MSETSRDESNVLVASHASPQSSALHASYETSYASVSAELPQHAHPHDASPVIIKISPNDASPLVAPPTASLGPDNATSIEALRAALDSAQREILALRGLLDHNRTANSAIDLLMSPEWGTLILSPEQGVELRPYVAAAQVAAFRQRAATPSRLPRPLHYDAAMSATSEIATSISSSPDEANMRTRRGSSLHISPLATVLSRSPTESITQLSSHFSSAFVSPSMYHRVTDSLDSSPLGTYISTSATSSLAHSPPDDYRGFSHSELSP